MISRASSGVVVPMVTISCVADGAPHKGQPDDGQQAPGGQRLDRHHRLLGVGDDALHPVSLYLHQEAGGVVDLDIGFHIRADPVGVNGGLGHVRGKARDHPALADHLRVFFQVADGARAAVDQRIGHALVRHAEGGVELFHRYRTSAQVPVLGSPPGAMLKIGVRMRIIALPGLVFGI